MVSSRFGADSSSFTRKSAGTSEQTGILYVDGACVLSSPRAFLSAPSIRLPSPPSASFSSRSACFTSSAMAAARSAAFFSRASAARTR